MKVEKQSFLIRVRLLGYHEMTPEEAAELVKDGIQDTTGYPEGSDVETEWEEDTTRST